MATCLVCAAEVKIGTLCREHSLAVATCDDITAEQVVNEPPDAPQGWLIDQWGCTHGLASPAVVGRAAGECNPGVLHPSVSVLHAEIERVGITWRVTDRGSLNGTFVNDHRVRSIELKSGDRLRFGDVSFFFSGGALPSLSDAGKTGGTLPSRLEDLSLGVTLTPASGDVELLQRPGGGILRKDGDIALELAQLEFSLLAALVEAHTKNDDPELSFVGSRALADQLSFKSHDADGENVRELVRRVRRKVRAAGIDDLIESRQRVGYRLSCGVVRSASR